MREGKWGWDGGERRGGARRGDVLFWLPGSLINATVLALVLHGEEDVRALDVSDAVVSQAQLQGFEQLLNLVADGVGLRTVI